MKNRNCITCNVEYTPTGNNQKYCTACRPVVLKSYYSNNKARVKAYQAGSRGRIRAYDVKYRAKYRKTVVGCLRICFVSLKHRCNNPNNRAYKHYGGRGIQNKFKNSDDFVDYVVNELRVDPRGLQIDRIDNDGHYEKGNIRFVTAKVNSNNRRNSVA